jgi:hypothetical protein
MAAFLRWIAENYEELQRHLQTRVLEIRSRRQGQAVHARLPSALAELKVGWEIFLRFAFETGAIGVTEKEEFEDRNKRALDQLYSLQASYQATNGCRWARESGGLREATYSWSPRPVIWWPRRWLGLSASR